MSILRLINTHGVHRFSGGVHDTDLPFAHSSLCMFDLIHCVVRDDDVASESVKQK
jgi:hypothetical protein